MLSRSHSGLLAGSGSISNTSSAMPLKTFAYLVSAASSTHEPRPTLTKMRSPVFSSFAICSRTSALTMCFVPHVAGREQTTTSHILKSHLTSVAISTPLASWNEGEFGLRRTHAFAPTPSNSFCTCRPIFPNQVSRQGVYDCASHDHDAGVI